MTPFSGGARSSHTIARERLCHMSVEYKAILANSTRLKKRYDYIDCSFFKLE